MLHNAITLNAYLLGNSLYIFYFFGLSLPGLRFGRRELEAASGFSCIRSISFEVEKIDFCAIFSSLKII